MGIDIFSAKFLLSEKRRGVRWSRTLTLGHQALYMEDNEYRALTESIGIPCRNTKYADDLFRGLGATALDVLDASDYEGANILHDLNLPMDAHLHGAYDCVFDGGALEHVFNFPTALKNCLEMVKPTGHFIAIAPASAYCGHGFYQFSPELFYSALSAENGFLVERILTVYHNQWYSVRSPSEVQARIGLVTREPTLLFVSARRVEQKSVFSRWPQESNYLRSWNANNHISAPLKHPSAKEFFVGFSPLFREVRKRWRNYKLRRQCSLSNRAWYTPISLD